MKTAIERQQETVARLKQSPCQCLEYHPKQGTDIYNEYLNEYQQWKNASTKLKGNVDKHWILIWLLASQSCPFIKSERKANDTTSNNK